MRYRRAADAPEGSTARPVLRRAVYFATSASALSYAERLRGDELVTDVKIEICRPGAAGWQRWKREVRT